MRHRALVLKTFFVLALVFWILWAPAGIVNADRTNYNCPSRSGIVCLTKGTAPGATCTGAGKVVLAVHTGCLIPDQNMTLLSFSDYANNTIFLDASGGWWGGLGLPQNVMVFQMQSYGNGSMDVRINGPAAYSITTDGSFTLYKQGSWGSGPEIIFTGSSSPTDTLTISWTPVGGPCIPFCILGQGPGLSFGIVASLITIAAASFLIALIYIRRQGRNPELRAVLATKRGERFGIALMTAVVTVGLDFGFHFSLTAPMEVPFYFFAKLLVSLSIAYFLVPRIGGLLSAAVFTFSFDVYYGIGVLLLHVPGLSSSPNQIIEIAGFGSQCLGYSACDLFTESVLLAAWTFFHGLFFFAGYLLANALREDPSRAA